MAFQTLLGDRLAELRELNRLFLMFLQARAREGLSCMNLPRSVARGLRDMAPAGLDRVAALPTALFRLDLGRAGGTRELATPARRMQQMHLSLNLTVLNSAWHMARGPAFEARMFLHLSRPSLDRLRETPLSTLPALACEPDLLSCAFTEARHTWPALVRHEDPSASRMLLLIALQPDFAPVGTFPSSATQPARHSFC
jgi:hypothetical protein